MVDGRCRPSRKTVVAIAAIAAAFSGIVFDGERRHREGAGPIRIDGGRGAEAVLAHQRAEAREERRELFGRRLRARVERVLHHPARRRIDDDRHAIDRRLGRMRLEIEQRERPQRAHIPQRRRQLQPARRGLLGDEAQQHVQHRGAAIAPLEARGQRLEQPRQDERQRLEICDRPLEIERRLEPFLLEHRHERPTVLAARHRLPHQGGRS
jgi:hypothetical protein